MTHCVNDVIQIAPSIFVLIITARSSNQIMSILLKAVDKHIKNKHQQVNRGTNLTYDVDSDDELLYELKDTSNNSRNSKASILGTKRSRMETVNKSQLSLVQSAFRDFSKNYFLKNTNYEITDYNIFLKNFETDIY